MPDSLINVNGDSVQTLEILFLTTVIALLPSMLIMMTSFTRIIISLSFLRTAMGTSQNVRSRRQRQMCIRDRHCIVSDAVYHESSTDADPADGI